MKKFDLIADEFRQIAMINSISNLGMHDLQTNRDKIDKLIDELLFNISNVKCI